jgi:tRNA (guanine-N7-)-methyltransferase
MYNPAERRNFYGRVHGKTLRQSQKTYLDEDLGRLSLPGVTLEENPARAALDLERFHGKPLWLEIWCTWPQATRRLRSSAASPS